MVFSAHYCPTPCCFRANHLLLTRARSHILQGIKMISKTTPRIPSTLKTSKHCSRYSLLVTYGDLSHSALFPRQPLFRVRAESVHQVIISHTLKPLISRTTLSDIAPVRQCFRHLSFQHRAIPSNFENLQQRVPRGR